jgi:hypothetical protein
MLVLIGVIIILLYIINANQCHLGDKLDESNRLAKQRNEILLRKN